MFSKTEILFCAVGLATLLTAHAKILHPSKELEREGIMCDKTLAEVCAAAAEVIPFSYPPEPKGIDETCSAISTHFPCIKNYASTCVPEDIVSRYYLTYLDICDSSSHLYEGVRNSIKCMKIAEKRFNETCIEPMKRLEAELKAFASKIIDYAISIDDWKKIETGLLTRHEVTCFLQRTKECDEGGKAYDTVEELFIWLGSAEKISILIEKEAIVEKVLDNLNLEDDQKMWLKE